MNCSAAHPTALASSPSPDDDNGGSDEEGGLQSKQRKRHSHLSTVVLRRCSTIPGPESGASSAATPSTTSSSNAVHYQSVANARTWDTSAPPCTTQAQQCLSHSIKSERRRNLDASASERAADGRSFLVEAVAAVAAPTPSPPAELPTPPSPSLRSPTPLDLTVPPNPYVAPQRLNFATDRTSASTAATLSGSVQERSASLPQASSNNMHKQPRPQQQSRSAASSSSPCEPHRTTRDATRKHRKNRQRRSNTGEEATEPGQSRRLSYSGSAEERSRSHSDKSLPAPHARATEETYVVPVSLRPVVEAMATPPSPPLPLPTVTDLAATQQSTMPSLPAFPQLDEGNAQVTQTGKSSHQTSPVACRPSSHVASVSAGSSAKLCNTATVTPPSPQQQKQQQRSPSPRRTAMLPPAPRMVPRADERKSEHKECRGVYDRAGDPVSQAQPARNTGLETNSVRSKDDAGDNERGGAAAAAATSPPRVCAPYTSYQHSHHPNHDHTATSGVCREYGPDSCCVTPPPLSFHPFRPVEEPCVPQIVPTHESVFFPLGTDMIAPVLLHYATVGGWSTDAGGRDFFNHRRLREGEVAGHTVRWLHTARPRDRFVFLVTPVFDCSKEADDQSRDAQQTDLQPEQNATAVKTAVPNAPSSPPPQQRMKWLRAMQLRRAWRRLHRRLFGEAPWFTLHKTACGARSRIAACDVAASLAADSRTAMGPVVSPTTSGILEPAAYSFPASNSLSLDAFLRADDENSGGGGGGVSVQRYGSSAEDDASPRPPHARATRSVEVDYLNSMTSYNSHGACYYCNDLNNSDEAEMRYSRTTSVPCCMSPQLVTRQPSLSIGSAHVTPVAAAAQLDRPTSCPTPLSLGLALPSTTAFQQPPSTSVASLPYVHRLATPSNATDPLTPVHAAASYSAGVSAAATADTHHQGRSTDNHTLLNSYSDPHGLLRCSATTSDFHPRASGSGRRFVFSPLTGTAVSTSGVSPVLPRTSKLRAASNQEQKHSQKKSVSPPTQAITPSQSNPTVAAASAGLEVIEIAHADITAMDYAPRLTSHRLSIETKAAYTYFFPTLVEALDYYQCSEAMALMQEQWAAGMTSQIPRPLCGASFRDLPSPLQQPHHHHHQQQQLLFHRVSVEHGCSRSGTPSAPLQPHGDSSREESTFHDLCSSPASSSCASHLGRLYEHKSKQQQQQQQNLAGQSALPPLQSGSLASALRSSAGGGGGVGDGRSRADHSALAPTRLFRQNSLLSLDGAAADEPMNEKRDSTFFPAFHARSAPKPIFTTATPPAAASTAAAAAAADQRDGCVAAAPSSPFSHCRTSVPPLQGDAARKTPPPPPQPRLTSTHHEIVVSVYTADPVFNSVLRELLMPEPGTHPYTMSVAEQKRLLSMVEVGMPAWAIFYSSTGLPYRRIFRLLYSGLTNLWPLLSLAAGVYDLYKHLPQLKRFMERTLDPLIRWLERRFTLRFSVLATYLISVVVTIFSSLSAFVSQFYVVQLLSLPIVQLFFALVKLPVVLAFDTIWLVTGTAFGTISLAFQLLRVVVMAPVVFVVNIASLHETVGAVAPVAVQTTSLSVKWWKAWSEFWETVASPTKNAVRAWWDSMIHVSTSAARRETSIRRWYTLKLERYSAALDEAQDVIAINLQMWWSELLHPALRRMVALMVALVYLYWLFLGISDKVWDDFLYASGVRHPSVSGTVEAFERHDSVSSSRSGVATTAAGPQEEDMTSSVTPAAALLHLLFQSTFDLFSTARSGTISSSSSTTTSTTSAASCAAAAAAPSRAAAPFTPTTSVIQMCDSTGSSIITKLTMWSTSASLGALTNATTTMLTTTITTVIPLPQASLSSLVAELLLPNVVLELLHTAGNVLKGGWGVVTHWTAARKARKSAKEAQRGSPSCLLSEGCDKKTNSEENSTGQPRCASWDKADKEAGVCLDESLTAETSAAAPQVFRMRRYVDERRSLVAVENRDDAVVVLEVRPTWTEVSFLRFGDTRGRETPREMPIVPADGTA